MDIYTLRDNLDFEVKKQKQLLGKRWDSQLLEVPIYPVACRFRRGSKTLAWLGFAGRPIESREDTVRQFLDRGVVVTTGRGSRGDRCFKTLDSAATVAMSDEYGLRFNAITVIDRTYLEEAEARPDFARWLVEWGNDKERPLVGQVRSSASRPTLEPQRQTRRVVKILD